MQVNYRVLFYRMMSELCYNVIKHADASKVTIELYSKGKNLVAEITDNGKGFQYDHNYGCKKRGLGLFGIKERLKYFGGTIKINSKLGEGTCVTIALPALEDL